MFGREEQQAVTTDPCWRIRNCVPDSTHVSYLIPQCIMAIFSAAFGFSSKPQLNFQGFSNKWKPLRQLLSAVFWWKGIQFILCLARPFPWREYMNLGLTSCHTVVLIGQVRRSVWVNMTTVHVRWVSQLQSTFQGLNSNWWYVTVYSIMDYMYFCQI